jgi:hypothetical protein
VITPATPVEWVWPWLGRFHRYLERDGADDMIGVLMPFVLCGTLFGIHMFFRWVHYPGF